MDYSNKKVLILYASAGHGHEKAARAVLEAIGDHFPGAKAQAADVIAFMPGPFSGVYRQTYLLQIKYTPWLWGMFYYSFDIAWFYVCFLRFVRRCVNALNSGKLVRHLQKEKPDVVVTTHFFATEVVSRLRAKGQIDCKLITVVTDYGAHYVWTASHCDLYAAALPETKRGLEKRGVPSERIVVTGIPVEKKFFAPVDRAFVRNQLGLSENLFTALVTSGGVGISCVANVVEDLVSSKQPIQLIVVCGTNAELLEKLKKNYAGHPNVKPLGFVNNMNELMEVCDIVVGKAGGLTITESFLKGKPVLLYRSIPGQEARNVDVVLAHGAGYATNRQRDVVALLKRLAGSKDELLTLKKAASSIAKPGAAKHIAELAFSSGGFPFPRE